MSDGADYGVPPSRALKTIIGGDPQPTDDELESVEEMRARILATPIRNTWHKGIEHGTEESAQAYEGACYATAHAILDEFIENPSSASVDESELWARLKNRYTEDSPERELLSSLSGFQVGWATNAARRCVELEPVPNPAIMTVAIDDKDLEQ